MLRKFKPRIVAVTGSVGKTSTKEAIVSVLSSRYSVRSSPKSYNSELGVPLTILGLETQWHSFFGWVRNVFKGALVLFMREYPAVLVLEMGVDRPGDMERLLKSIHPMVGVVTAIGEVPVHVEFFSGVQELAHEKGKLIYALPSDGCAVLNFDDEVVYSMKGASHGKVLTFGFGKGSDVRISQYKLAAARQGDTGLVPTGIACKIDYRGSAVPLRLEGAFGKQQAYVAAAAVAVGLYFELNLIAIVEALSDYTPAPGRLTLLEGIKESWILDDTYNASPMAMHAALDTLKDIPSVRRIAVLGDMLEIGKYTIHAHEAIGELAAPVVDILLTVGPRAKFIAKKAREMGLAKERIYEVPSSLEAGKTLQELINPGDIILVKGSQSMRMERTVEEIMAHPENKEKLLVRQDQYWHGA